MQKRLLSCVPHEGIKCASDTFYSQIRNAQAPIKCGASDP